VFVTGSIGDAALGLAVRQNTAHSQAWALTAEHRHHVLQRYLRPQPRLALGTALRRHASAAMDVSDGLIKDFDRLCRASGVAGDL
jgi:thiamine-monophosphate kinase